MTRWVVITCRIPGAYEEIVCSFFYDYLPAGIVTEDTLKPENITYPDERFIKVFIEIADQPPEWLEKLTETMTRKLEKAGYDASVCSFSWDFYQPEETTLDWQSFHPSVKIGHKLLIKPPWDDKKYQGRHDIIINPSMAFGTGQHPSTQLLLEFIEKQAGKKHLRILDCGTGSGVLAFAAAYFIGGSLIVGVDIEREAVLQAQENSALNQSSCQPLFFCATAATFKKESFDLIFANLQYEIVKEEGDMILELLKPGGSCLFSGLLVAEANVLMQRYKKAGNKIPWQHAIDEWKAFCCKREDEAGNPG